ncbi:low choriolytic enzyme-like [Brachyistius frenatus]|uniref:low choriolytic enzyme-like n=1 Tax=Brachyistius frenatus TaxID=100188 RepID=UPI0037E7B1AD
MDLTTTVSLLLLLQLLGLCNAHHGKHHDADNEIKSAEDDITTTILRMNNGSSDFLFEGDVLIPNTRSAMKCFNDNYSCLWPKSGNGNVEIPYVVSEKYDYTERNEILKAMKDMESKTCIRFIPRGRVRVYLSIEPRYGCSSLLGRIGDKQVVSLQKFGCINHGIIQHELLHALGFYHEHNRNDRDKYVRINMGNIIEDFQSNFKKKPASNDLNTPYDYSSVMHYGKSAFAKLGLESITPIPDNSVPIGQRDGLSEIDVLRINRLYRCWNHIG